MLLFKHPTLLFLIGSIGRSRLSTQLQTKEITLKSLPLTKEELEIYHAHAGGIIGGFSVCGARGGIVTDRDEAITCEDCLSKIRAWLLKKASDERNSV